MYSENFVNFKNVHGFPKKHCGLKKNSRQTFDIMVLFLKIMTFLEVVNSYLNSIFSNCGQLLKTILIEHEKYLKP